MVRPYFTDAPFSREFGEVSPGNLGVYIGWKMVESYLEQQKGKTDIKRLMKTEAKKIFNESRYKPK